MTYNMMQMQENLGLSNDFIAHANWACEFSFHSPLKFFKRVAYPVWHICVMVGVRLFGMPLDYSTGLVTAMFTVLCMIVSYFAVKEILYENMNVTVLNGCVFVLTFVTAIYIPCYNKSLYWGQGSPNIWHNPTNNAVKWLGVLIFFFFLKILYSYKITDKSLKSKPKIKWKYILALSLMLFFSVLLKPSFVQGFLPAVAVYMIIELVVTKGKNFYICCQVAFSFIPSCALILWQTFTYWGEGKGNRGGIEISFFEFFGLAAPNQLISFILGWAFPLFALILLEKKEIFFDKRVLLAVIMAIVSCCEEACLIEKNSWAGNFTWSKLLSMYILWVVLLPKFVNRVHDYYRNNNSHSGHSEKIKIIAGIFLICMHLISGIYYFIYLLPGKAIL